jgi:hypothetical protein
MIHRFKQVMRCLCDEDATLTADATDALSPAQVASRRRSRPREDAEEETKAPLRLNFATALQLRLWQDHLVPMLSRLEAVRLRSVCKALKGMTHGFRVDLGTLCVEDIGTALRCFPAAKSMGMSFDQMLEEADLIEVMGVLREHGRGIKRVTASGEGAEHLLTASGEGAEHLLGFAARLGALPKLTHLDLQLKQVRCAAFLREPSGVRDRWFTLTYVWSLLQIPVAADALVRYPLMITTVCTCPFEASVLSAGVGKRVIGDGALVERGDDAAQVAITFVSLHAGLLRRSLGQTGAGRNARLFTHRQNATLHVARPHRPKPGQSAGACIALGFVAWLGRCEQLLEPRIAITGHLDLRGRVFEVGGVPEKAEAARQGNVDRFLLPETSLAALRAKGGSEALASEWGSRAVMGVSSMVDVLALTPARWVGCRQRCIVAMVHARPCPSLPGF